MVIPWDTHKITVFMGENEDKTNKPPDFLWDPIFRPIPLFFGGQFISWVPISSCNIV